MFFVMIYVAIGGALALFVPIFHGLDEAAHYNRAYQVAEGSIKSDIQEGELGGVIPSEVAELQRVAWDYLMGAPTTTYFDLLKRAYTTPAVGEPEFVSYQGAAAYSPLTYLPASVVMAVTKNFGWSIGVYVALVRISMLAVFILIAYQALRLVDTYRIKWFAAAFLALPTVIFQASVLSADTLSIAFSLLLFSITYVALKKKSISHGWFATAVMVAMLLSLVKLTYLPVSILVLLLPVAAVRIGERSISPKVLKAAAVGLIVLPMLAWNATVIHFANMNKTERGSVSVTYEPSVSGQIKFAIDNPINTLLLVPKTIHEYNKHPALDLYTTMISRIGYNFMQLPGVVMAIVSVILMLAALYASSEIKRIVSLRSSWVLVGVSVLSALAIFGVLYLSHTDVGDDEVLGLQGRYFLPLIPFCTPLLIHALNISLTATKRRIALLVAVSFATSAVSLVVYYLHSTYYSI